MACASLSAPTPKPRPWPRGSQRATPRHPRSSKRARPVDLLLSRAGSRHSPGRAGACTPTRLRNPAQMRCCTGSVSLGMAHGWRRRPATTSVRTPPGTRSRPRSSSSPAPRDLGVGCARVDHAREPMDQAVAPSLGAFRRETEKAYPDSKLRVQAPSGASECAYPGCVPWARALSACPG